MNFDMRLLGENESRPTSGYYILIVLPPGFIQDVDSRGKVHWGKKI